MCESRHVITAGVSGSLCAHVYSFLMRRAHSQGQQRHLMHSALVTSGLSPTFEHLQAADGCVGKALWPRLRCFLCATGLCQAALADPEPWKGAARPEGPAAAS
jgi:hypothetical protein